ncbi:type II secretion system protein E (plasmid) [Thioalkalivibrio sp. K90mix]|uniref:GspE/PulE family protein n=1 Tax=Thioalkalivibrio sp. (strain K90mix) TaxID=396595 RepID=UPI000195A8CA|nr:GspE/PulE family protein [Thioalkalivibrio sp. K90mix]ADC73339.1 type II secretion system protein E [Thioalkalivibrio sp. K90mix]
MRLGDYLVEQGLLEASRLKAALAEQSVTGEHLGRILVRNGFIRQDTLVSTLRRTNPAMLMRESTLLPGMDAEVLAETRSMIIAELPDIVYVATLNRTGEVRRKLTPYMGGRDIAFVAASPQRVDEYLELAQRASSEDGGVLEKMIRRALNENASDLHIIPRTHSYTVLSRRLGVRELTHEGALEEYQSLAAQIKDRSRMDMAERRVPQDGGFSIEHNGRVVDMRVATLPTTEGESIVIRLLDPDRVNPVLDTLGITRIDEFRKAMNRAEGLCLICGPTGSGKTTTLNAAVREMEVLESAIYSIEDPVEYRIPYVGQVAINDTVGLDFARGVRAFMRSDPDVVIVGEIRDLETARNAIKAAETGHMVLGTLHTASVHGAIGRLRDIGVESHELRYLLRGVMAQRLVRTLCKSCGGKGCSLCRESGYASRTIVSETAYLPDVESVDKVIQGERWWPSMAEDVITKVHAGETDEREVHRVFGAEIDVASSKAA